MLALIQERIPTHIGARDQLLRQLNTWARQRPDWTVMLQRDHSWNPSTALLPSDAPLADNLVNAAPGQLLPLLGSCSACLTVSSPWSLAAMAWGRIPVIVGDYGIHDEQNTTGFFGCGAMHRLRSISSLDAVNDLPLANPAWLAGMGAEISDGPNRLINALNALERHKRAMTPTSITPTLSLLLIADSDSQLLACEDLCTAPTTLNVHWTINVIPRDGTPQVRCCNAWPRSHPAPPKPGSAAAGSESAER